MNHLMKTPPVLARTLSICYEDRRRTLPFRQARPEMRSQELNAPGTH